MNWKNVHWIWKREMRDQLRDRRTLFMVAVLPVLMYPLLGTSLFQLAQFMQQSTGRVAVYGAEELDEAGDLPPLLNDDRFEANLFLSPGDVDRLVVESREAGADRLSEAGAAIDAGEIEVAVCFPDDFAENLSDLREQLKEPREPGEPLATAPVLEPSVLFNSAREPSQVARLRVKDVLGRWRQQLVRSNLEATNVPVVATRPFQLEQLDRASQESRDAVLWSKLLPFIVFLWALTGAFYPAIDLCAGEKERGTLETLLASPARRSEIVGGKLLTVMTFSIFTALLNLASLAITTRVLMGQLSGIAGGAINLAPPTAAAMGWLVVAVVPMSALFSALSLAFAAYAKSTKEGQYYFMPLFLAATPLMLLPLSPGVELNLGNSFVPVMGLVLLLRAMIEGQTQAVLTYAVPVVFVTGVCCWLATRWAVSQFNQESVLFRESERFDLAASLRAMVRRRGATPSAGAAVACVAGVFLTQNAVRSALPWLLQGQSEFAVLVISTVLSLVVSVLLPAIVVLVLLTRDWRSSLLLREPPRLRDTLLAVGAAICLIPVGQSLGIAIQKMYPFSEAVLAELAVFAKMIHDAPIAWVLLLLALLPAVCEEITFRGVVLSGLRKSLGTAGGILVTAAIFAATHTVLQQSLGAFPLGVALGVIAVRSRSLIPCVLFHAVYNGLTLVTDRNRDAIRTLAADWGLSDSVFVEIGGGQLGYAAPIAILGGVVALVLLWAMGRGDRGNPQVAARLETAS
ncbi:ABC-2 family transporter protein [Planctomycetes bacterium MalM25]|nr:ABC-2 family transporter protein [Planctomycetes bacterium MalM25]